MIHLHLGILLHATHSHERGYSTRTTPLQRGGRNEAGRSTVVWKHRHSITSTTLPDGEKDTNRAQVNMRLASSLPRPHPHPTSSLPVSHHQYTTTSLVSSRSRSQPTCAASRIPTVDASMPPKAAPLLSRQVRTSHLAQTLRLNTHSDTSRVDRVSKPQCGTPSLKSLLKKVTLSLPPLPPPDSCRTVDRDEPRDHTLRAFRSRSLRGSLHSSSCVSISLSLSLVRRADGIGLVSLGKDLESFAV